MPRYIDRDKFLKKCVKAFGYAGVTIKAIEGIVDECVTEGEWEIGRAHV